MSLPRAMTVKDVAYTLHISCNKVYRMAKSGELPSFKAGSKVLFNREQIEAFMKRHVRKAGGMILPCLYFLLS